MKQKHNIEELKNFYESNNRLPNNEKEFSLYCWMSRERRKGNEKVIEFLNSVGYKKCHDPYTISDLIDFYKSNNRLPNQKDKKECSLNTWMMHKIREGNKEVIEFTDSVGYKVREKHNPYTISDLINFYKTYNRLPNNKDGSLYDWMSIKRRKGNKRVIEFLNSLGYKEKHNPYTISDLINFYKTYNRLPNQKEKGLYDWISKERKKGNEEVIEFLNSVGYKKCHDPYTIFNLINFYKSNYRLPNYKKENSLYVWMSKEKNKGNKEDFNEVKTFLDLVSLKDKSIEAKEMLESILKQTNV